MTNEEQQVIFTKLTTLMSSIVANFLVTREMPAEYLEILGQNISSVLQELDGVDEVEPMISLPDEEDEHEHGC